MQTRISDHPLYILGLGAFALGGACAGPVGAPHADTPTAIDMPDAGARADGYAAGAIVIPLGERGIHYADVGKEELVAWGPSAVRADVDGSFWISDGAARRLVHLGSEGAYLGAIALPEDVQAPSDIALEPDTGALRLFDQNPDAPAVIELDRSGRVRARHPLEASLASRARGLGAGVEATLRTGGGELAMMDSMATGHEKSRVRSLDRAIQLDAVADDHDLPFVNRARLRVGERAVTLQTQALLTGADVEHLFEDGSFLITLEEVAFEGQILADRQLWKFDRNGLLMGKARLWEPGFVYVEHPFAVRDDGSVFVLEAHEHFATLTPLSFEPALEPLLPAVDPRQFIAAAGKLETLRKAAPSCISRSTIIANAAAYVNNRVTLTAANRDDACTGRGKPRYMPNVYASVPYDWGGFDSVAGFNTAMRQGRQAGDIDTSSIESCSRGVDCSGFVSRVWGLSTRKTTRTLPAISCTLSSRQWIQPGDVINKAGTHVVMFEKMDPADPAANAFWYEATKTQAKDRVVRWSHPFSRYATYSTLRYTNVCGGVCE